MRQLDATPEGFARDARAARRAVTKVTAQIDAFERSGPGDELRWMAVEYYAIELMGVVKRWERRDRQMKETQ